MNDKELNDLLDQNESIPTGLLHSQSILMQCETHAWLQALTKRIIQIDNSVLDQNEEYIKMMEEVNETARELYNQHLAILISKAK